MAYFQQIDELLKPKPSDILSTQVPGETDQQGAYGATPQQSAGSNVIGNAPKTSAGGASNAAAQGKTPEQFTKVGYDPSAYTKNSSQKDLNLSQGVVSGAAQATQQLKEKSDEFALSVPKVPQYSEADVTGAITGNAQATANLQNVLKPQPINPSTVTPDFSGIKPPEILQSADVLASRLQKAQAGGQYTKGMSTFDAAMYRRSGAYQQDVQRAQDAVNQFNAQLDAEIKKYEGTDIGAKLQAAKDQLTARLGREKDSITGNIDKKLKTKQGELAGMPGEALGLASDQFNKLVDVKEKELQDRLNYLNNYAKETPGLAGVRGPFEEEVKKTRESLDQISAMRKAFKEESAGLIKLGDQIPKEYEGQRYIRPGGRMGRPQAGDVTTQDEANRWENIQSLLGGGELKFSGGDYDANAALSSLDEEALQSDLESLYLGSQEFAGGGKPSNLEDVIAFGDDELEAKKDFNEAAYQFGKNPSEKGVRDAFTRDRERNIKRQKAVKVQEDRTKKQARKNEKRATKDVKKVVKKSGNTGNVGNSIKKKLKF